MSSNVGSSNIYEAGDQRTSSQSELKERERYSGGKAHLQQDPTDNRTTANKIAREKETGEGARKSEEHKMLEKDATLPARAHGNEPSRGARIDQELREEDEEHLRQKGKK
ncbi:uncharacterized protein EI97DRAFT_226519 [Westerdykella ornata]|uniref:Uncharacterized protein n=1 Tax=Westerdykella ornata TaxID=318751 RepID=A0A6A6JRN4_WESOR|nr:uncharacterized protein EI97DRAFT_226519 [Westerdykella ornata]KAF2279057.1 hypothetical protein EI97DRAFT_226519 [Westerdykella ornata]